MLDQTRLLLLAKLLSMPIAEEGWLRPAKSGQVLKEKNTNIPAWLHKDNLHQQWSELINKENPPGIRQELADNLLNWAWGKNKSDPVELATYYRVLAACFLHLAGDRLNLMPETMIFGHHFSRLEMLLLWHMLKLRLGPDLLPVLLVADRKLTESVRGRLIVAGLVVDEAAMRPLADFLDVGEPRGEGITDCHVHAGSALRAEFIWPHLLRELELDPHFFFRDEDNDAIKALRRNSPLFLIAAVVRRILGLVALGRWQVFGRRIETVSRLLDSSNFAGDGFFDSHEELVWLEMLGYFLGIYVSMTIAEPEEPWLLVESRVVIDTKPDGHFGLDALWWLYIRIRARFHRHFIEEPGLEGLGYFIQIYQRSKALAEFRRRIQRNPAELGRQLNPLNRMRHIEIRIVPDVAELEEYLLVAQEAEYQHRTDRNRADIALVVHSVKWCKMGDRPLDEMMLALRKEITELQDYLQIKPQLSNFLVGLDVAGQEMHRPNWFYLPAFVEFRTWWRREIQSKSPANRGFGYTFHAGEDFLHLNQGLRHIGEIISFFPWEEGDRIGHGLALGLNAEDWQQRTPLINSQLDWILFDLVWEWGLAVVGKISMEPAFFERLQIQILHLGGKLLDGTQFSCDGSAPLSVKEWHQIYCGLFCPHFVLSLRGFPVFWEGVGNYDLEQQASLWNNRRLRAVLEIYLNLLDRKSIPDAEPYPFRDKASEIRIEAQRIKEIQRYLLETFANRHVAVEACPLSNQVITGIATLVQHPLLTLREQIPVLANTDNPLTFGTDLPLELRMLYEAELERSGNAESSWRMIREIVENGNRFRFGRPN